MIFIYYLHLIWMKFLVNLNIWEKIHVTSHFFRISFFFVFWSLNIFRNVCFCYCYSKKKTCVNCNCKKVIYFLITTSTYETNKIFWKGRVLNSIIFGIKLRIIFFVFSTSEMFTTKNDECNFSLQFNWSWLSNKIVEVTKFMFENNISIANWPRTHLCPQ